MNFIYFIYIILYIILIFCRSTSVLTVFINLRYQINYE